jgi:hypothetical protein
MHSPSVEQSSHPAALFRAPDGRLIVELSNAAASALPSIAEARELGADAVWVQAAAVDAALGFERRRGYARLEASQPPAALELARPPRKAVRQLELECFAGVWGQAEPGEPDPDMVYVGLHEGGAWVGICGVDVSRGWIDAPGVKPGLRTPDRYVRLVRGAAAFLLLGPVRLETWGDSAETLEAYTGLGFRVTQYVPGWELELRR